MKKLTTAAAILMLSGLAFNANAAGNDQGPEISVVPSMSERYDGRLNAAVNQGHSPEVTPSKAEKAVAGFNNSIDRS